MPTIMGFRGFVYFCTFVLGLNWAWSAAAEDHCAKVTCPCMEGSKKKELNAFPGSNNELSWSSTVYQNYTETNKEHSYYCYRRVISVNTVKNLLPIFWEPAALKYFGPAKRGCLQLCTWQPESPDEKPRLGNIFVGPSGNQKYDAPVWTPKTAWKAIHNGDLYPAKPDIDAELGADVYFGGEKPLRVTFTSKYQKENSITYRVETHGNLALVSLNMAANSEMIESFPILMRESNKLESIEKSYTRSVNVSAGIAVQYVAAVLSSPIDKSTFVVLFPFYVPADGKMRVNASAVWRNQ